MPSTEDLMKWWNSFTAQAFELGYDFSNPADRALVKYVVEPEELPERDSEIDVNILVSAFLGTDENPLREYDYHSLDWYLDSQAEPDEARIAKLYQKAQAHELILMSHTQDPAKNDMDSCRLISVDRDGNTHISKTEDEMGLANKSKEETDHTLYDEFASVPGNPLNMIEHLSAAKMYIINGSDHKPRGRMSLKEFRKITDNPDASDIQFGDLYSARFLDGKKHHEYFKPLGSIPNVPAGEQLRALTDTSNGITKLEEIIAVEQGASVESLTEDKHFYNYQFYDSNMMPFDPRENPDATRAALTGDGLFFFKQGENAPHKLAFNKEQNRLTVSTNSIEAPTPERKPNFLTRIVHRIATALGFKGFGNCIRYDRYTAGKAFYNKLTSFTESKAAFEAAARERNAAYKEKSAQIKQPSKDQVANITANISVASETKVYNSARQYQQKLLEQKKAFDKSDPDHGAHSEYRNLIKATASAMNHIAEMTRDGRTGLLGEKDNNYVARIVSLNLIQQEKVSHPDSNTPGPLETKLNELGAENFVNAINQTSSVTSFKSNITLEHLFSTIDDRGFNLAKSVAGESNFTETISNVKKVEVQKNRENILQ